MAPLKGDVLLGPYDLSDDPLDSPRPKHSSYSTEPTEENMQPNALLQNNRLKAVFV